MKYLFFLVFIVSSCTVDVNRTYDERETFATNKKQPIDTSIKPIIVYNYDSLKEGRELFNAKCNSCHEINKKSYGPALAKIGEKFDREWLYAFIRNSDSMINVAKDSMAIASYKKSDEAPMTIFPKLTDEEIDCLIHYCDNEHCRLRIVSCF